MKSFYFPALLCLALLASQCKKEDTAPDILPPVTQEGKNTAGFLLDGEVWMPFAKCDFFQDPCYEASVRYGPPNRYDNYFGLTLRFDPGENKATTLVISSLEEVKEPGEYFESINIEFFSRAKGVNLGSFTKRPDDSNGTFFITRLDTINQVVSGTFSFTLRNREGETVAITDGRFDYELNACICRD